MSINEFKEKRLEPRRELNAPLTYTIVGEAQVYHGHGIDMSSGGIMIKTNQNVKSGTLLDVQFKKIPDMDTGLQILTEVVRVERSEEAFLIASEIKEMKTIEQEAAADSLDAVHG